LVIKAEGDEENTSVTRYELVDGDVVITNITKARDVSTYRMNAINNISTRNCLWQLLVRPRGVEIDSLSVGGLTPRTAITIQEAVLKVLIGRKRLRRSSSHLKSIILTGILKVSREYLIKALLSLTVTIDKEILLGVSGARARE
jgi:hypothetical protein